MPDDIDMRVLLDLNTRTLVNGAAVDTNLIATAMGLSSSQLRDTLNRLQQRQFVTLDTIDRVGLTPQGHEYLTRGAGVPDVASAGSPATDEKLFYTSQNGDAWLLVTDNAGRKFVRHTPNKSSGGDAELTDLKSFVDREPHSPQNQALAHLMG